MQGTVRCPLRHSPCPVGFPGATWPAGVGEVLVGECQIQEQTPQGHGWDHGISFALGGWMLYLLGGEPSMAPMK